MQAIARVLEEVKEGFRLDLLSEESCRNWFLQRVHPEGAFCPKCRAGVPGEKSKQSFWKMRRVKCTSCRVMFNAATDTVLEGLKIDFRELYILLFMTGCGLSIYQVAEKIGVSHQTVRAWESKFRGGEPPGPGA